jgi:putative transposase
MNTHNPDYRGYRFPPEIIAHAVWLYHRFCLSFRDVEELLAERGVTVSYEAVHQWCLRFGQAFAKRLRCRQGRLGDTWHLDEVFVTIGGERRYLWRAVDQDGEVLDILVQKRRDKHAAKRFFRKLLKGLQYIPHKMVTDKLGSYGAARREMLSSVAHCQGARQNNRAEVSHQPTRQQERQMRRFKSPRQAQRFLSVHGPINNLFRLSRHLMKAAHYRMFRPRAFTTWRSVTCAQNAA